MLEWFYPSELLPAKIYIKAIWVSFAAKEHANSSIWIKDHIVLIIHHWTHWDRATHICVSKLTIIASDNCLSPDGRQTIIWNNAGILSIVLLGTIINFNRNSDILFQENALESVVFEIAAILSRPKCVNGKWIDAILRGFYTLPCIHIWYNYQNHTWYVFFNDR